MTIEEFAALMKSDRQDYLRKNYTDWQADAVRDPEILPGRVYTKVDEEHGHGRFMVDNKSGIIYGIKGYGQVHKGREYGTLETAGQWYWGEYTPRERRD